MIVVEGLDVGAIAVERRGGELFLADIEIESSLRGKGLSTLLLRQFMADAKRQSLPASLQVLKINPARNLYVRLGFQIVGDTDTHFLMRTPAKDPGL